MFDTVCGRREGCITHNLALPLGPVGRLLKPQAMPADHQVRSFARARSPRAKAFSGLFLLVLYPY